MPWPSATSAEGLSLRATDLVERDLERSLEAALRVVRGLPVARHEDHALQCSDYGVALSAPIWTNTSAPFPPAVTLASAILTFAVFTPSSFATAVAPDFLPSA